jgi:hypothetical protein
MRWIDWLSKVPELTLYQSRQEGLISDKRRKKSNHRKKKKKKKKCFS